MTEAAIVVANVALIALVIGMAHLVGWAGPSFAAGLICGGVLFLTWYRVKFGRWP